MNPRWYVRSSTPHVWHLATDASRCRLPQAEPRWHVTTACGRLFIATGARISLKEWLLSNDTICTQCHALSGFDSIGGDE